MSDFSRAEFLDEICFFDPFKMVGHDPKHIGVMAPFSRGQKETLGR